ncbi:MAG: hypothetical protein OEQ53_13000, partial [Saprospiraceae bacterium]|nr:hypothetical protein [Saprospiraceae bacterium]
MESKRQLAAIMFSDIVGYTTLMGRDEKLALSVLRKNKEIHKSLLKRFKGEFLKELGDGVLSSFQTVTDAVYCAGELLNQIEDHKDLNLRIGIHLGEIVLEEKEVYGDGVNIASRIQSIADSGQLLVSETIYKNIRNKQGIETIFVGEKELKNVDEPVRVYEVKVEGIEATTIPAKSIKSKTKQGRVLLAVIGILALLVLGYYYSFYVRDASQANQQSIEKSIAVLPFEDMSPVRDQEYFADGVMEEIINQLTGINDLSVIPRTSMLQYKGTIKTISEIAKELNVATVLSGSVRKDRDQLRISVSLNDGLTNKSIWNENYNRQLRDVFAVQGEIARAVGNKLQAQMGQNFEQKVEKAPTESVEAYDLFLKGIYEYRSYASNSNNQAIDHFNKAIALDSSYAQAYAGLAMSQFHRASVYQAEIGSQQAFTLMKPLIDKALDLDPNLPEARGWNGVYLLYNNWDFEGAERQYRKAIETDHPDALAMYADFLNFTRRHDEALAISERLNRSHPFYPNGRMVLSLYYVGKYEEATDFAESRLLLFNNYFTLDSYGFLMLNTGNYEKAIELFQRAIDLEQIRLPRMLGWMGAAYAHNGEQEKSLELIEELKAQNVLTEAGSLSFFTAVIYAALGDK